MNLGWPLPFSFPASAPHVLGYDLCLLTFELCELCEFIRLISFTVCSSKHLTL